MIYGVHNKLCLIEWEVKNSTSHIQSVGNRIQKKAKGAELFAQMHKYCWYCDCDLFSLDSIWQLSHTPISSVVSPFLSCSHHEGLQVSLGIVY